jgi:hypothetical protein
MPRRPGSIPHLAAAVVLALLLAGCRGGDDEPAASTDFDDPPVTEPATATAPVPGPDTQHDDTDGADGEPATDTIDITEVPDEITEAYVEAVLAELERIWTDALIEYQREGGELTLEVTDRIASIFTDEQIDIRYADFGAIADADFVGARPPEETEPADHQVTELISATPTCINVRTLTSIDGLLEDPPPPSAWAFHLVLQEKELYRDLNPTPWVIAGIPADVDSYREQDPCDL